MKYYIVRREAAYTEQILLAADSEEDALLNAELANEKDWRKTSKGVVHTTPFVATEVPPFVLVEDYFNICRIMDYTVFDVYQPKPKVVLMGTFEECVKKRDELWRKG